MRVVGMDIHRSFAQVAILDQGEVTTEKRVELVHDKVVAFGRTLKPDDEIVLEAAWSARTAPGPLRAFFARVSAKRGAAAAIVATARKLAVLIWHVLTKDEDYAFARPAFQAMKLRKVALKAGAPREYRKAGPGRDYWIKEIRHREMAYVKRAEDAYARMVAAWREAPPKTKKATC